MRQSRRQAAPWLALCWMVGCATAKVMQGEIKLSSQDTEKYMVKFSFSAHKKSHIKGTFNTPNAVYFDAHPHDMRLCLYDEEAFAKFQHAMKAGSLCNERAQMAQWATKIHPTFKAGAVPTHEFSFDASLRPPSSRAHYWFAVLMDCQLEEYDAHPPALQYTLTFTNGRSQLPADEAGMPTINLLALVGMGAYGFYYLCACTLERRCRCRAPTPAFHQPAPPRASLPPRPACTPLRGARPVRDLRVISWQLPRDLGDAEAGPGPPHHAALRRRLRPPDALCPL